MKYKGKIKYLLVAGLLALNLSGCKGKIQGYSENIPTKTIEDIENNDGKNEKYKENTEPLKEKTFKEKLQEDFKTGKIILDKTCNKFISSIKIDGRNVSLELVDGSQVSGDLENLKITDVNFENFYIYDSKYIDDLFNVKERYKNYKEKGFESCIDELNSEYEQHKKLYLDIENCSVSNEYKKGIMLDIEGYSSTMAEEYKNDKLDYSNCKKLWLDSIYIDKKFLEGISSMSNLETLIISNPDISFLDDETIKIKSKRLKNILIDGITFLDHINKFDFTRCPNLEVISIFGDTQETNLNGLQGLKKLKKLAFGLPSKKYNLNGLIVKDFQERIEIVSEPFPTDNESLAYTLNCFISDISAIKGSNIETLNISFLKCVSSEMLLETVKSLPKLKEIVGFEINNAGMCSDELIQYCYNNGIKHPFSERSLEIKHKLQKIASEVIVEEMDEKEKIKALSEYVIKNMEYDYSIDSIEDQSEKIKKGWGECLYYSVIEGKGVCQGYTTFAQNLFTEAGIKSFKTDGLNHTWNLVQIDDEYYWVDLTAVDIIVDEETSSSFDDYNLDKYYLVPIDENIDIYNYTIMLPIEAEEEYNEAKEKIRNKNNEETEKLESIKTPNYMVQVKMQNTNSKGYSNVCGLVGILSALGLAKKVENKENIIGKNLDKWLKEGIIEEKSFRDLLRKINRIKKINTLKQTRRLAENERNKNEKARLQEITQDKKGENR